MRPQSLSECVEVRRGPQNCKGPIDTGAKLAVKIMRNPSVIIPDNEGPVKPEKDGANRSDRQIVMANRKLRALIDSVGAKERTWREDGCKSKQLFWWATPIQ